MTVEKVLKYIIITAGIAAALFLLPLFIRVLAPFIAAFFVAAACQNIVKFLERRFKISRGISSAALVTVIVASVLGLLGIIIFQVFSQAKNLIVNLPDTISAFRIQLNNLIERFNGFKLSLSSETAQLVNSALAQLWEYASSLSGRTTASVIDVATNFVTALPGILVFLVMFILGTFFFTKDYLLVINFLKEIFPAGAIRFTAKIKKMFMHAFSSYIKAQLILMLLTAFLVTAGLWVVGKDYPLLWGIVCGAVDALPLLGTAVILIPWALISLIYGDMYSFVSLLIIQALVFVVRQLAEPKVISRQIGIHPIITLISIYIGLKFFGITGAVFAPIVALLAVNFYVSYKEQSGYAARRRRRSE